MIASWNVCLNWVGITNSIILNQIVPWEAGLLELTLFDQAYPVLQIAFVRRKLWVHFPKIWIKLKIRM